MLQLRLLCCLQVLSGHGLVICALLCRIVSSWVLPNTLVYQCQCTLQQLARACRCISLLLRFLFAFWCSCLTSASPVSFSVHHPSSICSFVLALEERHAFDCCLNLP